MAMKRQAMFITLLILSVMTLLSGCGTQSEPGPGGSVATPGTPDVPRFQPDKLRIVSDEPALPPPGATFATPGANQPDVTVTDAAQVRQLFATIYALPALPQDRACTAERGPHYTLTFLQGDATVATVEFHRDGCWPVFIAGDSTTREGSKVFVQQLDEAIISASPLLKPDRFAIATAPQPEHAPQSALITSATTAQQLYDAMLALPRSDAGQGCSGAPLPTYQIVFFSGDQSVPASVDNGCQTAEVDGSYRWRGGRFVTNDQFRSLLQSILAGITLEPAKPDQLSRELTTRQTSSFTAAVSDEQLVQALYAQVYQLPAADAQPSCPPEEYKLSGKGTFTTLAFSQWDLPLVRVDTYQGSCNYVQISGTGPYLKADQSFWDLIDRAQQHP
jgi:hypothetical protein